MHIQRHSPLFPLSRYIYLYNTEALLPVYLHRCLTIFVYTYMTSTTYATPVQEISANAMMTTRVIRFSLCRASSPSKRVNHINIYTLLYNTLNRRTIGVTQRNVPITRLYWCLRRNFDRHTDALEPREYRPRGHLTCAACRSIEWSGSRPVTDTL